MKDKKFDIITIDGNIKDLLGHISSLKKSRFNILYTNCNSRLKIGSYYFDAPYNTILYCDDSDILFLIKTDEEFSEDDLRVTLDMGKVYYHEISFDDKIDDCYESDTFEKKICIVRNERSLRKAIMESKQNGNDTCTYYPYVDGRITLKYHLTGRGSESIDYRNTKGLIELEDKIILLLDQNERKNVNDRIVLKVLSKNDMDTSIDMHFELPRFKCKVYQKKK